MIWETVGWFKSFRNNGIFVWKQLQVFIYVAVVRETSRMLKSEQIQTLYHP